MTAFLNWLMAEQRSNGLKYCFNRKKWKYFKEEEYLTTSELYKRYKNL